VADYGKNTAWIGNTPGKDCERFYETVTFLVDKRPETMLGKGAEFCPELFMRQAVRKYKEPGVSLCLGIAAYQYLWQIRAEGLALDDSFCKSHE
jgi:hypothetical protein